jgi:hypothetical protein
MGTQGRHPIYALPGRENQEKNLWTQSVARDVELLDHLESQRIRMYQEAE